MPSLDHLRADAFSQTKEFKSTLTARTRVAPQRDRVAHGTALLNQLGDLRTSQVQIDEARKAKGLPEGVGLNLTIEVNPPGSLDFAKKVEWRSEGIEVLSSVTTDTNEWLTVHVPEGKLAAFEKRVTAYVNEDMKPAKGKEDAPAKPKNAALVNAIDSFRRAAFDELWTDDVPPPDGSAWFQVWLRTGKLAPAQVRERFSQLAASFEIEVEQGFVVFPGRTVVSARATREGLHQAIELLDLVAEIRSTHPTAEFFVSDLSPHEQAAWIQDLLGRLVPPSPDSAYVTVLDTGVNHGHPLLVPLIDEDDVHTLEQPWGGHDHEGHGTEMSGLAAYGDLTELLPGNQQVTLSHRLESVKILPPTGANDRRLYGAITGWAVGKVEQANAARNRVFALMTTEDGHTIGVPSEWSAAIDRLASGLPVDADPQETGPSRLFVISAGNIPQAKYLQPRELHPIESPGQAWNALTVGACTDKSQVDVAKYPSYKPISAPGTLAPCSSTSLIWRRAWPFKPDVVSEGGNACHDTTIQDATVIGPSSLRLLTTAAEFNNAPLSEAGDTSGAAAQVARLCARVASKYPDYWPETVRALVIHGARITPAMRSNLSVNPSKLEKENLLREVGFGVVNSELSLMSETYRPTLVIQQTLQPYSVSDGKLKDMNLHALPWPAAALLAMGEAEVTLRVTLSYFIEPNPSRRGWQSKFRYQSHGLRFAVKGSTESEHGFMQRINQLARDDLPGGETPESTSDPDRERWTWGAHLRNRGSVHSDEWRGSAAALAEKSHLAVFPVGGWRKDSASVDDTEKTVRYTLVVSLEAASGLDIDIYTPIANAITIAVQVPT